MKTKAASDEEDHWWKTPEYLRNQERKNAHATMKFNTTDCVGLERRIQKVVTRMDDIVSNDDVFVQILLFFDELNRVVEEWKFVIFA